MKKLLTVLDEHLLKWLTLFALLFIPLYPKLPTIHIIRTWVYIRLEDFLIAFIVVVFLVQLSRKKIKLPFPIGIPIIIYWAVGLCSLLFSLIFISPHLTGFFPHIAILEYGRRIEYMILFFAAFATIRSQKDVRDYIVALLLVLIVVVAYGFGQRYYIQIWSIFPAFFEKYSFCFPSFQTGNEQFAKGLALCLPQEGRITSTFGGHYDLAGFLVVVLPILVGLFAFVKKVWKKITIGIIFITSLMLLVFTASRVSFVAYLFGAIFTLIALKRKKLLIPVIGLSLFALFIFNSSTAKRFFETFRIVNVVTNNQGQVVGLAETALPSSLKDKIAKNDSISINNGSIIVKAPPPTQNLPTGSSFITLSGTAVATSNAYVRNSLPTSEAQKLKLASGGFEISTVSGSFLIQKALVYDISFTTRLQAEWPNAWAAFMSNPPLGKGYSTITLATDNDYLRLLGESGFLGFSAFALIFLVFSIFLKEAVPEANQLTKYFTLGLAGGVVGLFANATLIDVFEASKIAEPLWLLLGVGAGALTLTLSKNVAYISKIKKFLSSHMFLVILLGILAFVMFGKGLGNFFVADDFTWLKWAATSHLSDLASNFLDANGSIYRPVAKIMMYVMYSIFSFQPIGYHVVGIFVHIVIAFAVYLLGMMFFKKKVWAWMLAALYIVLPIHAETLFWISTISVSLSTLFILYSILAYAQWRKKRSYILYAVSLFLGILSMFSYELGVVLPLFIIAVDSFLIQKNLTKQTLFVVIPYFILDAVYLFVRFHAHVAAIAGDYSYNVSHLIPNVIVNFFNYILATFFGEKIIAWQYSLRLALKSYSFPITAGLLVIVILLMVLLLLIFKKRNKELVRNVGFGFVFAFISLMPFLGFGNMTEHYGYLSAFGLAWVVISVGQYVLQKQLKYMQAGLILAVVFYFLFAKSAIDNELQQWIRASKITYNTLAYFRVVHEGLPKGATLYISHLPIRYGNAWIFPVGLKDGLWFIYRDNTLKVLKTPSVEASLAIKMSHTGKVGAKEYVFDFDKNGQIVQY